MTTHGGKRPGSGRKKNPTGTKTISFRIKKEWEQPIKELVREKIKELKTK